MQHDSSTCYWYFFIYILCLDYNGEVLTFRFTWSMLDESSLWLLHTIKELYAFWTSRFIKVLDCVNTTLNELSTLLFTLYLSNTSLDLRFYRLFTLCVGLGLQFCNQVSSLLFINWIHIFHKNDSLYHFTNFCRS